MLLMKSCKSRNVTPHLLFLKLLQHNTIFIETEYSDVRKKVNRLDIAKSLLEFSNPVPTNLVEPSQNQV